MNKTVKRLIKIGAVIGAIAGTMYVVNRYIEKAATILNKLKTEKDLYYKWRFGNIYYEKTGEGSPILLIHDFTPYASSYEWKNIVNTLAANHTVYTIDLLGCGRSDKPAITYTNFMYVQIITDFINDIIGEKVDIITSGHASSIALMSTNYTCENINKLLLINPEDLATAEKESTIYSKITKTLLEIPILGTFIYNMLTLRGNIESLISEEYLYNASLTNADLTDAYFEAAHRGGGSGRYIMSSILGNYMETNIPHALNACENEIFIIGGEQQEKISEIIDTYKRSKPEIGSIILAESKKLPHYEVPEAVLEQINNFIE